MNNAPAFDDENDSRSKSHFEDSLKKPDDSLVSALQIIIQDKSRLNDDLEQRIQELEKSLLADQVKIAQGEDKVQKLTIQEIHLVEKHSNLKSNLEQTKLKLSHLEQQVSNEQHTVAILRDQYIELSTTVDAAADQATISETIYINSNSQEDKYLEIINSLETDIKTKEEERNHLLDMRRSHSDKVAELKHLKDKAVKITAQNAYLDAKFRNKMKDSVRLESEIAELETTIKAHRQGTSRVEDQHGTLLVECKTLEADADARLAVKKELKQTCFCYNRTKEKLDRCYQQRALAEKRRNQAGQLALQAKNLKTRLVKGKEELVALMEERREQMEHAQNEAVARYQYETSKIAKKKHKTRKKREKLKQARELYLKQLAEFEKRQNFANDCLTRKEVERNELRQKLHNKATALHRLKLSQYVS